MCNTEDGSSVRSLYCCRHRVFCIIRFALIWRVINFSFHFSQSEAAGAAPSHQTQAKESLLSPQERCKSTLYFILYIFFRLLALRTLFRLYSFFLKSFASFLFYNLKLRARAFTTIRTFEQPFGVLLIGGCICRSNELYRPKKTALRNTPYSKYQL